MKKSSNELTRSDELTPIVFASSDEFFKVIITIYLQQKNNLSIRKYSPVGTIAGIISGGSLTPFYIYFGMEGLYKLIFHFSQNVALSHRYKPAGLPAGIAAAITNALFITLGLNKIAIKTRRTPRKFTCGNGLFFCFVSLPSASGAPYFSYLAFSNWHTPLAVAIPLMAIGWFFASLNNQLNIRLLGQHFLQLHHIEAFMLYRNRRRSTAKMLLWQLRSRLNHAVETLFFGLSDDQIGELFSDTDHPQQFTDATHLLDMVTKIENYNFPTVRLRVFRACQLLMLVINSIASSYYIGPGKKIGEYIIKLLFLPFKRTAPQTLSSVVGYGFGVYLFMLNTMVMTLASVGVLQQILKRGSSPGFKKLLLIGVSLAALPAVMAFLQAYLLENSEAGSFTWSMCVAVTGFMQSLLLGMFSTAGLFLNYPKESPSGRRLYLINTMQELWQQLPNLINEKVPAPATSYLQCCGNYFCSWLPRGGNRNQETSENSLNCDPRYY